MTKLRIMSDLHLEFGPIDLEPIGEDVLVLAGDVGVLTDGAVWARDYARRTDVPVVMIAGNHEFYRRPGKRGYGEHTIGSTLNALRAVADSEPLLTFLEDDLTRVADVLFVGCTLWTDYRLYGDAAVGQLVAGRALNDHRLIYVDDGIRFLPLHAESMHKFSTGVLRELLLRRYPDGPVVVMTHHLPSAKSIATEYRDDPVNAAYASNLDALVAASGAALWVHGHTHVSFDYRINGTRVLCNPRGYYPHGLNPLFDPNLVVEV